jgi:hypothetical protein
VSVSIRGLEYRLDDMRDKLNLTPIRHNIGKLEVKQNALMMIFIRSKTEKQAKHTKQSINK